MKKIISDTGFEQYLDNGGGLSDIHPDISHLVYAAYASGLIITTASWAGTVGKHIDEYFTNHKELVTYQPGFLLFEESKSVEITRQIIDAAASKPYARLHENNGKYTLELRMDDLVVETLKTKGIFNNDVFRPLIKESDGTARYGEFMEVWNSIYDILRPFVQNQTDMLNLDIIAADVAKNSVMPYPRRLFCDFTKSQFQ